MFSSHEASMLKLRKMCKLKQRANMKEKECNRELGAFFKQSGYDGESQQ